MKTLVKIGAVYFTIGAAIFVTSVMDYAFYVEGGKQEIVQMFRERKDVVILSAIATTVKAPILFAKGIIAGSSKEED